MTKEEIIETKEDIIEKLQSGELDIERLTTGYQTEEKNAPEIAQAVGELILNHSACHFNKIKGPSYNYNDFGIEYEKFNVYVVIREDYPF